MPCRHHLTTRCKAALIATALLCGPAFADTLTITGDPNHRNVAPSDTVTGDSNHRKFTPAVDPALLTEAPKHRRLGLTHVPDGSGLSEIDFAVREIDRQGYTEIMVLGAQASSFTALDAEGREMVIRFDPHRSLITEVIPRSEIRARRMAGR
jgi:hypothetical protein